MDIVYHSPVKDENGNPLQRAALLGAGPTIAKVNRKDDPGCTIVTLNLMED